MENREIAVRLSGVKKMYKLGQIGGGTLTADLQSWWARVRGKEDPNTKIGTDQRLVGQTFMALNGIDLTIYKGEAVGIIGGNGAGKSTMLKLLSRVTAPTEGKIWLNGRVASMLEVGTGFNGEMTGRENIYMNGAILGMTKAEIDAKMEDIIEFSEVREFIDTPVKRYSSGMYVKLAFSVAAHLDSEIMIMDEVLAVGDMAFQKKCLNKMRDAAKQEGRTVLYVSHNMNTIRQLCDRCIVLDQGKVVFEGDVNRAVEIYLGVSDDANCVSYDLSDRRMDHLPKHAKVKMMQLNLLEKELPVYREGEEICFSLKLHANNTIDQMRMRFEVRYSDDVPVGTAQCTLGSIAEGQDNVYFLRFSTKTLTRGRYKCLIVIHGENEYGTYEDYDAIWPTFFFELEDNLSIAWNTRMWGHIKFPDVQIDEVVSQ